MEGAAGTCGESISTDKRAAFGEGGGVASSCERFPFLLGFMVAGAGVECVEGTELSLDGEDARDFDLGDLGETPDEAVRWWWSPVAAVAAADA